MYSASLDVLRAFSIIGVMLVHAGAPGAELGWLGVDLFFVLSGFLITTLFLSEHRDNGKLNLKNFFVRRILRLFPAYYLYVSVLTLLMFSGVGSVTGIGIWSSNEIIGSMWGYYNNFIPRGGFWEYDSLLIHLWSLSVEEQYYIIWPAFLVFFLGAKNRLLLPTCILIVIVFIRFLFEDQLDFDDMLYTRGVALFIGSYIAILFFNNQFLVDSLLVYRKAVTLLPVVLIVILYIFMTYGVVDDHYIRKYPIIFIDISFAFLIVILWSGGDGFFLSNKYLIGIGKISYGIYLYHMLVHYVVWDFLYVNFDLIPYYFNYAIRLFLYFAITVLLSYVSYEYYEKRFLNLKRRFR